MLERRRLGQYGVLGTKRFLWKDVQRLRERFFLQKEIEGARLLREPTLGGDCRSVELT
jgi:hypothetical protein